MMYMWHLADCWMCPNDHFFHVLMKAIMQRYSNRYFYFDLDPCISHVSFNTITKCLWLFLHLFFIPNPQVFSSGIFAKWTLYGISILARQMVGVKLRTTPTTSLVKIISRCTQWIPPPGKTVAHKGHKCAKTSHAYGTLLHIIIVPL